jgi:hypothetical protein
MQIRTKGIPDNVSRSLCKESLRFYANELLGKRLAKNISLQLVFEELPSPYFAICDWNDDGPVHRSFIVIISKTLKTKMMLVTLAHEMVHIKQYARKELQDNQHRDNVKWRGKAFCLNKTKYHKRPWEIEAYAKDKPLYEKFKQRNK